MFKAIAFDIDGTLIDDLILTYSAFLKFYKEKYGKSYLGKYDRTAYSWKDRFVDATEADLRDFENAYWLEYMKTAPFRPYVKELFEKLHSMGIVIHILTARGSHYQEWQNVTPEMTEEITIKRFKDAGIHVDEFHICLSEKLSIMKGNGIDLIVEDSPAQIEEAASKFPVVVMDCPYNKDIHGRNIWRITDYNPTEFINTLKYIENHIDSWEEKYVLEDGTSACSYNFEKDDTVVFNPEMKSKKSPLFVVDFGSNTIGHSYESEVFAHTTKSTVIRLSLIDSNTPDFRDGIFEIGDSIVRQAIMRNKKPNVNLEDPNSRDTYLCKVAIIKDILDYVKRHPKMNFVIDGVQIFMLNRNEINAYSKNPIIVTGITEQDKYIIRNSAFKEGITPWNLLEELTEVATQLRKWRIISGTAPKELPSYINRQTTNSDGVDIVRLLPGEKPYNERLLNSVLSPDTFLVADLHLSTADPEKTKKIIRSVNKVLTPNDHLLILGDLDGKKGTGSFKLTKDTISKFNTKNVYLVLGNNDPYTIDEYVKCGFKAVVDMAIYQETPSSKVFLTHCPYPTRGDEKNIHGHIHGSKCYWNLNWENHYDVWDEDYAPITIRQCLEIIEKGLYHAKSETHNIY